MTHPFDREDQAPEPDHVRPARKRRGRKLLAAVAVLVLLAAVAAGGYLFTLARTWDSGTHKIDQAFPAESTRPRKTGQSQGPAPMNILVMGSDSRGATGADTAGGAPSDQRADTLMLVHVPADRRNIYTVSVMRDLWVEIPGHGEAKINAALALGGTPLMVQTIESLFQQRNLFQMLTQTLPGRRSPAGLIANHKNRAHAFLQQLDTLRHGRGGNSKVFRGRLEAATADDRSKRGEMLIVQQISFPKLEQETLISLTLRKLLSEGKSALE